MLILLLALHLLSAVLWVGGMYFVLFALRPALPGLESAPERPKLMRRVLARFLPAVAVSVLLLIATGYAMLFLKFGGFAGLPLYVNLMQGLGWVMILLFAYLYHVPWLRFRRAVDDGDLQNAPAHLERIRLIVQINLLIGIAVVVIAATGPLWT